MISYKDKLLLLSFKKISNAYLHLIETELSKESKSLEAYKNTIPDSLSNTDKIYTCQIYNDMISQNHEFVHLIKKMNFEISQFYSAKDLLFSLPSVDTSNELSQLHLKKVSSLIKSN